MDLSMLYFFEVIGHLPFPLNFIVTAEFHRDCLLSAGGGSGALSEARFQSTEGLSCRIGRYHGLL